MIENNRAPRSAARASYLSGLLAAVVVIALAVIFWSDFRGLTLGWQIAVGFIVVVLVLRIWVAGLNVDRSQVAMADALYNAGQYQKAHEELTRVLQEHPSNAEALYLKGQCLDRLSRSGEAMAAWREALKHSPKHGKAAHNLACEYLNQGKYVEAAEYFGVAREGGAWAESPGIFEQNVENTKKALLHMGRQAEARHDHRDALRYADALVKLAPKYALAYAWRAQHNAELGNYRAAVDDARACLQLNPEYNKARLILSEAQEALNAEIAQSRLDPGPPADSAASSVDGTATTEIKEDGNGPGSSLQSRPTLWRVGDRAFDRWQIRRIMNQGGMGTIYAAWDSRYRSAVALKTVQLESGADSSAGRRAFRQEAEHWLRLGHHPRIVRLHSVEKLDYRHIVLVTEYVAGQEGVGPTLYDHLKAKNSLMPHEACRIAIGICEGIRFAYAQCRLVHRDLKPENVFITALGEVKVGDFGLATIDGQKPNSPAGTLAYAAPEQWEEGRAARPTLDVYSLGVMLFEMVCGRRPCELPDKYRHADPQLKQAEYERMHREVPPPSPRDYRPDLDPHLEALILQCLAKKPGDRPTSLAELEKALGNYAPDLARTDPAFAGSDSERNPGLAAFVEGVSLSSLGFLREALECYDKAVRYEPLRSQRSEAWTNKAKTLGELHRFRESVAAARRAVEIDPRDLYGQHCLAMSLGMLGLREEALSVFDRLIAQDRQRADSHVGKGAVLLSADRIAEARAAYEQALALKPDHQIAVNGLGLCAEQSGDLEAALRCFERAIGFHEEFAEAHANRDRVLILQGRRTESIDRTLDTDSDKPLKIRYYLDLGFSLHDAARFTEAREALNRVLELDSSIAAVHLALAQCCGELGDYAKAYEHASKAVALGDPRGAEIAELARLCLEGKDPRAPKTQDRDTAARGGGLRPDAGTHRSSQQGGHRGRDTLQPLPSSGRCACGFRNPPGNTYCHECGKSLESEAPAMCPRCGGDTSGSTNYCVQCGKKLS